MTSIVGAKCIFRDGRRTLEGIILATDVATTNLDTKILFKSEKLFINKGNYAFAHSGMINNDVWAFIKALQEPSTAKEVKHRLQQGYFGELHALIKKYKNQKHNSQIHFTFAAVINNKLRMYQTRDNGKVTEQGEFHWWGSGGYAYGQHYAKGIMTGLAAAKFPKIPRNNLFLVTDTLLYCDENDYHSKGIDLAFFFETGEWHRNLSYMMNSNNVNNKNTLDHMRYHVQNINEIVLNELQYIVPMHFKKKYNRS